MDIKQITLKRDRYQWILTITTNITGKNGQPSTAHRQTYHRTLDQVAAALVDMASEGLEVDLSDILEVAEVYRQSVEKLAQRLKNGF